MNIQNYIQRATAEAMKAVFDATVEAKDIQIQETRKEFTGDFTVVVFPLTRSSKRSPQETAEELGHYLTQNMGEVERFEVVKGFLNLSLTHKFWTDYIYSLGEKYLPEWEKAEAPKHIMVEYSSPNTNKPLHLGHIRNNLLGYAMAEILKARGHKVTKANLINDRGIHICKSMLAWQRFGNGETPESSGLKGDHLVGKYYVRFDKWTKEYQLIEVANELDFHLRQLMFNVPEINLQEEINSLIILAPQHPSLLEIANLPPQDEKVIKAKDIKIEVVLDNILKKLISTKGKLNESNKLETIEAAIEKVQSIINENPLTQAQEMLRKWEAGDEETIKTWKMMNGWVYEGFDVTYKSLGVDFDKFYYESQTYLHGKEIVIEGLESSVFYRKDDGSVWVDLTDEGLDEKLVLRGDGTSVYITQDMGTAQERFDAEHLDKLIYVVGNEQEYHFKVLQLIFKKLDRPWYNAIHHLSYGMVELPSGKMKSREGTVVDADDLIAEMLRTSEETTKALGKANELPENEQKELFRKIGMAALKFYILKADPRKGMMFNPEESIDFQGFTGPFIQYTYARIQSILRKAGDRPKLNESIFSAYEIWPEEREVLQLIYKRNEILEAAENQYSPALLANYAYDLAKTYNKFYHERQVLNEPDEQARLFRLQLSQHTANCISQTLLLLGIEMPERM